MESIQPALFYDRIEDAIDEVVRQCGGRKTFACDMWPDKPPRDAHNLLDACLNPERREKLAPTQIMYVIRRGHDVGCHALIHFMCSESGYSAPQPVNPKDERAELQRQYIESARAMARLAERIERVNTPRAVA